MASKNIQKCVRMTQNIYDFVDKQKGNGFNEKFENMIIHYVDTENDLIRSIEYYEKKLDDLKKQCRNFNDMRFNLQRVSDWLGNCEAVVNSDMPDMKL